MSDTQEAGSYKLKYSTDGSCAVDSVDVHVRCLQYTIIGESNDSKIQLKHATTKDWRGPHQKRLESFALDYFGACWFNPDGEMEVCGVHRAAKLERNRMEQATKLAQNRIMQAAELEFDHLEQVAEFEWNRIEQAVVLEQNRIEQIAELAWIRIEQYCSTQTHCPRSSFPSLDGPSDDTPDNHINSWLTFVPNDPAAEAGDGLSKSSLYACSGWDTSSSPSTMYTSTQQEAIGSHLTTARSAKQSYAVALASPPPNGVTNIQKRQPAIFKRSASNSTPSCVTKMARVNGAQLSGESSQDKPRGSQGLWKLWESKLEAESPTRKESRFAVFFNSPEYVEAIERARDVANLVETPGETVPMFLKFSSGPGDNSSDEAAKNSPKVKVLGGSFDSTCALDGSQDNPQYRALANDVDELVNPEAECQLRTVYTANTDLVSPTPFRPFYWNFFTPESDTRSLAIIESSIPVVPMPAHFGFYSPLGHSRHPASLSSVDRDDDPFFTSRPVTAEISSFTKKLISAGLSEGIALATQDSYQLGHKRSSSSECFVCGHSHDEGYGSLYQLRKTESLWA